MKNKNVLQIQKTFFTFSFVVASINVLYKFLMFAIVYIKRKKNVINIRILEVRFIIIVKMNNPSKMKSKM